MNLLRMRMPRIMFQIIGLQDVFTPSPSLSEFSDLYLVTHLMGADLNNIVKTQKLSDDHVQFLVYQILRGMKYVHSAGIIHRVRKHSAKKPQSHMIYLIHARVRSMFYKKQADV